MPIQGYDSAQIQLERDRALSFPVIVGNDMLAGMDILEVRNLTKIYKTVKAVDGISFSIPQGICFGLLGPNGAGKTTTIEMIEGITTQTSGEIFYQGQPRDGSFKNEAGIQFQQTSLPDYLTVFETLKLFASFYPKSLDLSELAELCDLETIFDQYSTRLSGGQRQRLLLALALINDPAIVFLDEPTTGLDPQARRRFWTLIELIKSQGKTVLLTTHYMDEAEYLCDELLIIDHGKIIDSGTPNDLLNKHFGHTSVILDRKDFNITEHELSEDVILSDLEAVINSPAVETTISKLIKLGVNLTSLRVRNPTLEDLFIKLTGHQLREG